MRNAGSLAAVEREREREREREYTFTQRKICHFDHM